MGGVTFGRCKDILCHDQYIHVLNTSVGLIGLAQGWTRKVGTSADVMNSFFCSTLIFSEK